LIKTKFKRYLWRWSIILINDTADYL